MKVKIQIEALAWLNKTEAANASWEPELRDVWWNRILSGYLRDMDVKAKFKRVDMPPVLPNKTVDYFNEWWMQQEFPVSTVTNLHDFCGSAMQVSLTTPIQNGEAWAGYPLESVANYDGKYMLPFPFQAGGWGFGGASSMLTMYRLTLTSDSLMLPSWFVELKLRRIEVVGGFYTAAPRRGKSGEISIWVFGIEQQQHSVVIRRILREILNLQKGRLALTKKLAAEALYATQHQSTSEFKELVGYSNDDRSGTLEPRQAGVYRKLSESLPASNRLLSAPIQLGQTFQSAWLDEIVPEPIGGDSNGPF